MMYSVHVQHHVYMYICIYNVLVYIVCIISIMGEIAKSQVLDHFTCVYAYASIHEKGGLHNNRCTYMYIHVDVHVYMYMLAL